MKLITYWNMLKKPTTNENRQIHRNYQKTTIATTTDHAITIKCINHPRWNRYFKTRTVFRPNTKIEHSQTGEYFSIYQKIKIDLPLPKQESIALNVLLN